MKLVRILGAASAALLLTASLATACDGHKAKNTSVTAEKSGTGDVQLTSGGGGCAKSKATSGDAQLTSGGGCAKGEKMASGKACCKKDGAMKAGGACADKAKMAGGGCCAKKGEPVMASVGDATDESSCKFRAGTVALKGTVLCQHCDLKKSETCATMFKTESGCLFALSGDKASALREAAVGGSKLVRVKGEVNEKGELVVGTYRVVRTLDSGASAM